MDRWIRTSVILTASAIFCLVNHASAQSQRDQSGEVTQLSPGEQAGEEWINSRGMAFCWCPPGSYLAGSPAKEPGRYADETQRRVVIDEGFWIGKYEVTKGQWTGSPIRNCLAVEDDHPQDNASCTKDAGRALKALNELEAKLGALPPEWEYALPTEEQWEYAARAGAATRFYFGDDVNDLPKHANFSDRSYYETLDVYSNAAHRTLNDRFASLAPVGSFAANPWGLHDVYGNLAEWCDNCVARGGSWATSAENCRSAYRHPFGDRDTEQFIGFRFVIRRKQPERLR